MDFPVAQTVNNLPAMQETRMWSLDREDPLQKGKAIHSSILAWRITWTEKPGRLQFVGSQRVRHNCVTNTHRAQLEGFWDVVTIKPMKDVMEKKRCLWCSLPVPKKLGRQVRRVWKIRCGICHGIGRAVYFSVSLEPLTMALAFHFSIGQYKYINY